MCVWVVKKRRDSLSFFISLFFFFLLKTFCSLKASIDRSWFVLCAVLWNVCSPAQMAPSYLLLSHTHNFTYKSTALSQTFQSTLYPHVCVNTTNANHHATASLTLTSLSLFLTLLLLCDGIFSFSLPVIRCPRPSSPVKPLLWMMDFNSGAAAARQQRTTNVSARKFDDQQNFLHSTATSINYNMKNSWRQQVATIFCLLLVSLITIYTQTTLTTLTSIVKCAHK